MQLYGREWSQRELEERIGRLEQVGGIRRLRLSEGLETDVEQIQVRTGAGLAYYVSPSRGLDISLTEFGGVPLSWQSSSGDAHPAYYDGTGIEWLRTAVGGLLMTCGLTYVGAPGEDEGEAFGLHGRIHHLPARQVAAEGRWINDDYEMRIGGIVEQTGLFLEQLRLTREIHSTLGANRIVLKDIVKNIGFEATPHMLLYHFNFGFPLLNEATELVFPSRKVIPRDEGIPVEGYNRWQTPELGYKEHVYYHEDIVTENEKATVMIRNPHFPLADGERALTVQLSWSTKHLPKLVQWKMPGAGAHVMGIEPANCYVEGRAIERQRGTLVMLEPGEALNYELELEINLED